MAYVSLSPTPSSDLGRRDGVLVVGAGCGGVEAALALRANGWTGPIDLFDAETAWPYHKPPLSKAFLKGAAAETELHLCAPELLERERITLHLGREVEEIDRQARTVRIRGEDVPRPYSHLVLALGGRARTLPGLTAAAPAAENVHHLRTFEDSLKIREALRPGGQLVIVGGGFIGLEVAATARELGLGVIVLEAAPRLLQRSVGPAISEFLESLHRARGVEIRTGVMLKGFDMDSVGRSVRAVRFDGTTAPCDLMVVAIGLEPTVHLAATAGFPVDNGILVDANLRTPDPAVFAIGDCARFHSVRASSFRRLESVPNALDHARRVAALICGKMPAAETVPWFWTEQFDASLKMAGLAGPGDEEVLRGCPESGAFSSIYMRNGRMTAIHSVNRPADFMGGRKLIEKGIPVTADALADASRPLVKLASG